MKDLVLVKDLEDQQELMKQAAALAQEYADPQTDYERQVLAEALATQSSDDKVIDLVTSVRKGWRREDGLEMYDPPNWPRVAVIEAQHALKRVVLRSWPDGSAEFTTGKVLKAWRLEFPPGTDPKPNSSQAMKATTIAPSIPPRFQPLVKPGILLFWEAEGWQSAEKHAPPPPPRDPALLEQVGNSGWLYRVIAEWDLTEIERRLMIGI